MSIWKNAEVRRTALWAACWPRRCAPWRRPCCIPSAACVTLGLGAVLRGHLVRRPARRPLPGTGAHEPADIDRHSPRAASDVQVLPQHGGGRTRPSSAARSGKMTVRLREQSAQLDSRRSVSDWRMPWRISPTRLRTPLTAMRLTAVEPGWSRRTLTAPAASGT